MIFTEHNHWPRATNFPDTATHAVDFGPGGLSGIGPMTARNLEGRGVRVIVIGDKAKGTSELLDAQNIKNEQWWSKKFTPSLVKTRLVNCYVSNDVPHFVESIVMVLSTSTHRSLVCWASRQSWSQV